MTRRAKKRLRRRIELARMLGRAAAFFLRVGKRINDRALQIVMQVSQVEGR